MEWDHHYYMVPVWGAGSEDSRQGAAPGCPAVRSSGLSVSLRRGGRSHGNRPGESEANGPGKNTFTGIKNIKLNKILYAPYSTLFDKYD